MNLGKIAAGMGVLIGIFLFISNATQTAKIISSIGSTTTQGIKTLQGRG